MPPDFVAALARAAADIPDADLVRRFNAGRDDAAFAALVRRHGPLVWAVARNLLPTEADAEDAFQATFLALVRSAKTIRDPAKVGPWLHAAAVKVATRAKRDAVRRKQREVRAAVPEEARPAADWAETAAAVHAAVAGLPPRERAVFVLCGLEGVRQADAAADLGLALNSVSGLLARARARVLAKLAARGLAPAAALVAVPMAVPAAAADRAVALLSAAAIPRPILDLALAATEVSMAKTFTVAAGLLTAALAVGGGAVWSQVGPGGAGVTPPSGPPTGVGAPGRGGSPGEGSGGGAATGPYVERFVKAADVLVQRAAAPKWEYKLEWNPGNTVPDFATWLTDQGNGGWEYVGPVPGQASPLVFKRVKPTVPGPNAPGPGPMGPGMGGAMRGGDTGSADAGMPGMMPGIPGKGRPAAAADELKVFKLRNVPAATTTQQLTTLLQGRGLKIVASVETNSLLAYGTAADLATVAKIIEALDVAPPIPPTGIGSLGSGGGPAK